MARNSLRTASVACLVIWAAIWILFLTIRVSHVDIRVIPGIGFVMLTALVIAFLTPIVAIVLAGAALYRQPGAPNLLTLGCAIAALFGQALLFLMSRWL